MAGQESLVMWGAGAIGGSIAAHLIRAGTDVLLVDSDEAHVAAINGNGLRLTGPIADFTVGAKAVTPSAVTGTFDHVFLAVKGHHTTGAAAAIAPHLAPGGVVVSLQNGLNGEAIAAAVGRERTMLALVNFASDVTSPGVIHYGGRGRAVLGELDGTITARLQALVDMLHAFDPAVSGSENVLGFLWGKLGYGSLLIGTALTSETIPVLLDNPALRPILAGIGRELMQAAAAEGVRPVGVDGFDAEAFLAGDLNRMNASFQKMADHYRHSEKNRTGVWRDLAVRKRPTEVSALLEPVIRIGERHGLSMPLTTRLVRSITEIENGLRDFAVRNLTDLAA
ncbi:ketopantoate reductase family protein [Bosea sp. NBC_00550]|uniref:ketopantoate reductase family protein n=1 Tax=Bosea sp. NBC_00550 TaxID=2969621 RepID=UPI00222F7193|nr:2-dehydropantoate 2-reductase [Bosea sp. NBC_00550]UZF94946.1 2-dehydropantoate 2-reductase [Bosea sp. NBC_00550]